MNAEKFRKQIEAHEGCRFKPYPDTLGKITIGIGHNLTDCGISRDICEQLYAEDFGETALMLDRHIPWWKDLDDVRQRVLFDMAFTLKIKLVMFTRMLDALRVRDYAGAAREMLDSKWAKQVKPTRAGRLAAMMRTGEDEVFG